MHHQMLTYIEQQQLFSREEKLLLAVSGGADSVVMTHLLFHAGYNIAIAHCNFKLRGNDSDEDQVFAEKLAQDLNIPFYTVAFNTGSYAAENKLSIQMAARDLRYTWLEKIRAENNFNKVCTAHHLNDSIETVLINLIKGTGISGLTGIKTKNNKITRPLLFALRKDIESYANENKINYRTDISNFSEDYLRNKIRLSIIPLLKEINPSFETTMMNNMLHLQDIEYMSDEYFKSISKDILIKNNEEEKINIKALKKNPATGTILYYILRMYNFLPHVSSQVFQNRDAQSGKVFYSSTHRAIKHGDYFIIEKIEDSNDKVEFIIEKGQNEIDLNGNKITFKQIKINSNKEFQELKKMLSDENFAAVDEDKIQYPLIIRNWKTGDYFIPFGMKGRKKKLSDFFIDHKISLDKKSKIKVITSAGEVVWVAGMRIDERYALTNRTINVLLMQLINKKT